MKVEYDVQAIIDNLKEQPELDPDSHDGCYELMRSTVAAYSRSKGINWDSRDLDLVYRTTIGTWKQGIDIKKRTVDKSNLPDDEKEKLTRLWDDIWKRASQGKYTNHETGVGEKGSIGLFGTGFSTFQGKANNSFADEFIRMCTSILPMKDDQEMFDCAETVLKGNAKGMGAASASMILHCLKPFTFPVLNSNMGNRNIFEVLGVKLLREDSADSYIFNCQNIKRFRDNNFTIKNYRIFDIAAWTAKQYIINPECHSWLIVWNKNNWEWDDFEEKCESTKSGKTIVENWACATTRPEIGDEVFLIKLGQAPKGIMGHGIVCRAPYEKDHYDASKASEGKKEKAIDVRFDRLINYEKDRILTQEELNEKCSSQHWSPQNSGIEIKQEVLPTLQALWADVTKEETKMANSFDHNIILFGPPGTGKTYYSAIYAVAICDGKSLDEVRQTPYEDVMTRYRELKKDGRIEFTTFHQSYGYEEFIEGIKPKLDQESNEIGYTIEDGVFKKFCDHAGSIHVQSASSLGMKDEPRIWGMILGGSGITEIKKECFENNEVRLGWSEIDDNAPDDNDVSWQGRHMVDDFKNNVEIGDIVVIEKNLKSIDAIGVVTGDYEYDPALGKFPRRRKVRWLVKDIDCDIQDSLPAGRKQMGRFSLFAFDYIGLDAIIRIINKYSGAESVSTTTDSSPHVFIIDEINRGNISKIFGELITLIEESKRAGNPEGMDAILPYSGKPFSVPNNVYLIGTMNTADRSIALMDTALRRRFRFIEMMPDSEVLKSQGIGTIEIEGELLDLAGIMDTINRRITYLFDREHMIGHAFFTPLRNNTSIAALADIFEKNIIPLLQEYFYEDYSKIQLVLGDNDKNDEFKFILDKEPKVKDVFKGNPDIDLPEKSFEIQHSAFYKLESYKQIVIGD